MPKVNILDNALAKTYTTVIRDKNTTPELFRANINRLTILLIAEACKNLPLKDVAVETPLQLTTGSELAEQIAFVPIIRAGIGMCDAALELMPSAEIFHLGMYRDEETFEPVEYYQKFSAKIPDRAFVIDPMLATGGSADSAIARVKTWGVKKIELLCIISAPEGVKLINKKHPDTPIYTCVLDEKLNEKAYILPGLGDAGDRIFNT
ncbi:MAG: uracil phosphoribosyltransferase [Kiritimatiellae bacterium]|jgi:uracil phosphoribosyltransferase|nr:uracil phosphoribosyltransferase [Kiritimatiellia bacterium]